MNNPWLRGFGALVCIAGLAFVAREVFAFRSELLPLANNPPLIAATLLSAVVYAAALMLLAIGWARLLVPGEAADAAPRRALVSIFASSAIAKYLPGNVLHFAGRQAMAGSLGISQKNIAMASLMESLCTLAAGLLLALLALAGLQHMGIWVTSLVAVAVVAAMLRGRSSVAEMFALALIFFAVNQAILGVFLGLLGQPLALFLPVSAAYLLAWAAGNVLPGAPGGLGIREGAFVALCEGFDIGIPSIVLLIAIAMRCVSLIGDPLFSFFGVMMKPSNTSTNQTDLS